MAKFDPVLKQHVADVERGASHTTYSAKDTQNELSDSIGEKNCTLYVKGDKASQILFNYFGLHPRPQAHKPVICYS